MKIYLTTTIVLGLFLFIPIDHASADCNCVCNSGATQTALNIADCSTICSSYLGVSSCSLIESTPSTGTGGPTQTTLDNPLGGIASPQQFIGKVIQGILGVTGSLALLMFIYGGFLWMTAAGASERVEKGKQTLLWATLGLIVIFTSYAAVSFITTKILGVK